MRFGRVVRLEISFEKFRCFGERQSARMAPITLLVGENSAGKSTFMAGLRYILDFTGRNADPSFNKDPFFLGGYKNIAHFRGGKYGRAQEFRIGISRIFSEARHRAHAQTPDMFGSDGRGSRTLEFILTFTDIDGEARPTEYSIKIHNKSIKIFVEKGRVKAFVRDRDHNFEREIGARSTSRLFASRNDFLTLEFFLRDLSLSAARNASDASDLDVRASVIVDEIWGVFRRLGIGRPASVYALAPVRTRPLRSYDPTQLSQSSEGDQLIAKLGRMARLDAQAWQSVRSSLENYGRVTGLFEAIKIQKLGSGDSDPFQILVKTSGREMNIIDVGYGVSQVLPLFIMLSELDRRSTLLIQQPEVHLHPSAQAALGSVIAQAASRSRSPSFVIETHSDFVVDRVRLAVRDGVIKPSDVEILFFQKSKYNSRLASIALNQAGEMIGAPAAYREFFLKESMAIMGF